MAGILLSLCGCGSGSGPQASGNFSGTTVVASHAAVIGVAGVSVTSGQLTGGTSTPMTVTLTQPAPAGGIAVQLQSSDVSAVVPVELSIPAGAISAPATISTLSVNEAKTVAITASYGDSVAGTSLNVAPSATSDFTVSLQPSTLTIAPGKTGSTKVTAKITSGFDHALTLSASSLPDGVSVKFSPTTIPAPGSGTATTTITVSSTTALGTHSISVKASDGKITSSATLTLKISSSDPGATFQGCWYQQGGSRYQGVLVSVANPGTYTFDADLYYGTTCDPDDQADEFGFGQELKFGGFDYIFWFDAFKNQSDMSALWHVGKDTSACVNYETAPDCP
jgi:hypothetical protein